MSVIAFSPPIPRIQPHMAGHYSYPLQSSTPATMADRRMSSVNENGTIATTVLIRKLPKNTSLEALRAMLLFAKDLKDAEIVPNELEEDQTFSTALARFSTMTGAKEAQAMLDGKPNTAGQANMIVEVISGPVMAANGRRNTIDPTASRNTHPMSPPPANAAVPQRASRFNGTFQSIERSPPMVGSPPIPEHSSSEGSSHLQTIFSSQSPLSTNGQDRSRVSGKSVIGQDTADDDTGELLKDPVAYMNNDISIPSLSRRPTNPQIPISRFASLSLNTNMPSPAVGNYTSPRSAMYTHTPSSAMSPTMGSIAGHPLPKQQQYLRHNYPPVNPADQNPPCNTLYVGNLPIDTSEDELKAMFSKQRGYKRLCFRTKQNGPMCFVEFEDVSFATKALNELYGVQLHNSVKGGIRLSFSKNPLGVRAGQPGSANPSTPLSASGPMSMNGLGAMSPGGFSTANGPPPGLSAPPGLNMAMSSSMSPPMLKFSNQGLGIGSPGMHNVRSIPIGGNVGTSSAGPQMSGPYPDYMMGR